MPGSRVPVVEDCGRAAAGVLGRLLGDDLVGAFLTGSGALGGAGTSGRG